MTDGTRSAIENGPHGSGTHTPTQARRESTLLRRTRTQARAAQPLEMKKKTLDSAMPIRGKLTTPEGHVVIAVYHLNGIRQHQAKDAEKP